MARWVRCGFSGAVMFGEYTRRLGVGAWLDLDEVVGRRDGRPITLGELLAGRLESMTPIAPDAEQTHG